MLEVPATPIVSFDIFDTLVTRVSGKPATVFDCVASRARSTGVKGADDFPGLRKEAEAIAIDCVGADRMSLDDIYEVLAVKLGDERAELFKEFEIKAEYDLCMPITGAVEFFNRCAEAGKMVVLISDMYLSHKAIEAILAACGISGYANLYVSCEYGQTKRSGELFKTVLNDLGVRPQDLTHYGDNFHADVKAPKALGCSAVFIKNGVCCRQSSIVLEKAKDRIFSNADVANFASRYGAIYSKDELSRIGYSTLGPVLVEFCNWINELKDKQHYDSLVFVARDGFLMKKAYDILYPNETTSYLLASRRSVTVPMLWKNADISSFRDTAGLGREMSVEEILMRLGMDGKTAFEYAGSAGFSLQDRLVCDELELDKRFVTLFENSKEWIAGNSKKEFSAMAEYYKRIFRKDERIALVDLGWRGSIQHSLSNAVELLGFGCELEGLYFGVSPKSKWFDKQPMHGFLFSKGVNEEAARDEEWFNALVESFFMAPHGTAMRYYLDEDGNAQVELGATDNEGSPLFMLQEAALQFVADYSARAWGKYEFLNKADAVEALYELGLAPSASEASALGDCIFAYQEVSSLAKPQHGPVFYCLHPKSLYQELSLCYWKPAYLKRLVRLPLPYWRLLKTVKQAVRG